jgi:uncharacterized membrane protein
MLNYTIRYVTALVVLIVGDALWLSYFAKAVFRPTLGQILLDNPRWWAAGIFYLIFAFGVVFFSVMPALRQGSWIVAVLHGATFGFLAYMTYDLTNLATIRSWTVSLAIADTLWGTLITAAATTLSYGVSSRFVS